MHEAVSEEHAFGGARSDREAFHSPQKVGLGSRQWAPFASMRPCSRGPRPRRRADSSRDGCPRSSVVGSCRAAAARCVPIRAGIRRVPPGRSPRPPRAPGPADPPRAPGRGRSARGSCPEASRASREGCAQPPGARLRDARRRERSRVRARWRVRLRCWPGSTSRAIRRCIHPATRMRWAPPDRRSGTNTRSPAAVRGVRAGRLSWPT